MTDDLRLIHEFMSDADDDDDDDRSIRFRELSGSYTYKMERHLSNHQ